MKKVISFSLYGDDPKYWHGAVANIRLAKKYYKDWKCRFYVCDRSSKELTNLLLSEDCEVVWIQGREGQSGLFWRFYAMGDSNIMICRDTDSRLSEREANAVNQWLETDKSFHIMRDHPFHNVLIPGGMWGCRNMQGIIEIIDSFPYKNMKGDDQIFLSLYIYPQIKDDVVVHDGYHLFDDATDFPTQRINDEFVGASYDHFGYVIKS